MRCFTHPSDIPIPFALAVHAALNNTATADDWDTIDLAYDSEVATVDAIARIFASNGNAFTDRERAWWLGELSKAVRS
ncbi:MAG: hypothetical protein Q8P18_18415 [Pseudomonadota bacterium]|nr:hypothetical protein [Pseudomonadota bacterium]